MVLKLDHVVVTVNDLYGAIQDYEALGFTVFYGGIHANHATHNALIIFGDGSYIELLALTGNQALPDLFDFSPLVDGREKLVGFAMYTDDIEGEVQRLRQEGFNVSDIFEASQTISDRVIRWKMALIDKGFAPFLIQDITPKQWRVSDDPGVTTHQNRAVGIRAVEILVRDMSTSRSKFTRFLGRTSDKLYATPWDFGDVVLHEPLAYSFSTDALPNFLAPFGGNISQQEIDRANPALEPGSFQANIKSSESTQTTFREMVTRERIKISVLGNSPEALFSVYLTREQAENDHFFPERTRGVYFQHFTGVPLNRGMEVLKGLDEVDWSAVHHAYGPATDIPDLLRQLTSLDNNVRNNAHEILIGNIVHQGTIYEASVEVIPFLIRMIDAPEIDKKGPLDLLGYITHGGIATPHLREMTQRKLQEILPYLIKNLSHPDVEVRLEMAENLLLYPNEIEVLEPLLKAHIGADPVPRVRAQCLQSLVALWSSNINDVSDNELPEAQQKFVGEIMRETIYPAELRSAAALILMIYRSQAWREEAITLLNHLMLSEEPSSDSDNRHQWQRNVFFTLIHALRGSPETTWRVVSAQAKHTEVWVREQVAYSIRDLLHQGITFAQVLPIIRLLLDDLSPDVREKALGIFYNVDLPNELTERISQLAENDPSLMVRTRARNIFRNIRP